MPWFKKFSCNNKRKPCTAWIVCVYEYVKVCDILQHCHVKMLSCVANIQCNS